jgi:hypothetical protein
MQKENETKSLHEFQILINVKQKTLTKLCGFEVNFEVLS